MCNYFDMLRLPLQNNFTVYYTESLCGSRGTLVCIDRLIFFADSDIFDFPSSLFACVN